MMRNFVLSKQKRFTRLEGRNLEYPFDWASGGGGRCCRQKLSVGVCILLKDQPTMRSMPDVIQIGRPGDRMDGNEWMNFEVSTSDGLQVIG